MCCTSCTLHACSSTEDDIEHMVNLDLRFITTITRISMEIVFENLDKAHWCADYWMHSVESPSMVDPQWNVWYWGSKWNLHTVCWSAVGCEWGTTSVYFGITYVCFIPSRLPVFAVEPQYLLQYFLFLSKVSFELHILWYKIFKKFHVGLKFEWGL